MQQPFIALMLAQHRQAELVAESHSQVPSSSTRRNRRGLVELARRAVGAANYQPLDVPALTNYPYRP